MIVNIAQFVTFQKAKLPLKSSSIKVIDQIEAQSEKQKVFLVSCLTNKWSCDFKCLWNWNKIILDKSIFNLFVS